MQHGVCRMFADTTAPHITSINTTGSTIQGGMYNRKDSFNEKINDCDDDDDEYWTGDLVDDGDDDSKSSIDGKRSISNGSRPSNHSEIEKRRRDKMNNFISEIATMVPSCAGISRRMDKLTVLRLAVQHIKTLKGTLNFNDTDTYKPHYVSDEELQKLLSQDLAGFVMCINCDTMKIVYVSDDVRDVLGYPDEDLIGQNFLCLIHSDDLDTIKSQVYQQKSSLTAPSDNPSCIPAQKISSREWSVHRPGSKRSFYCRIKSAKESSFTSTVDCKEDDSYRLLPHDSSTNWSNSCYNYRPVHCKGFLKSCSSSTDRSHSPAEVCQENSSKAGKTAGSNDVKVDHLILLIQPVTQCLRFDDPGVLLTGVHMPLEFTSRISYDGRFIHIDQAVTTILGYLPQELIRTSYCEYIHKEDVSLVNDIQKKALEDTGKHDSPRPYRFRTRRGCFIQLTAKWRRFINPWSGDFQFTVIQHRIMTKEDRSFDRPQQTKSTDGTKKLVTLTQMLLAKDDEARNGHGMTIDQWT